MAAFIIGSKAKLTHYGKGMGKACTKEHGGNPVEMCDLRSPRLEISTRTLQPRISVPFTPSTASSASRESSNSTNAKPGGFRATHIFAIWQWLVIEVTKSTVVVYEDRKVWAFSTILCASVNDSFYELIIVCFIYSHSCPLTRAGRGGRVGRIK